MAIRTTTIELIRSSISRHDDWMAHSAIIQEATNCLWRYWIMYHTQANTAETVRRETAALKAWHESDKKTRGDKPKPTQFPFPETNWQYSHIKQARLPRRKDKNAPRENAVKKQNKPDLLNDLYHILTEQYPTIATGTLTLLIKKWSETIKSRESANGSLPGWVSIILNREAIPSFTKPLPIPFDKSCGKPLRVDGDTYTVHMKIERGDGGTIEDTAQLMLNKRKIASVRATVNKIIEGSWAFKGSELKYDKGKWFVAIAYDKPPITEVHDLDEGNVLIIRAGRKCPWRVSVCKNKKHTHSYRFGGNGNHVELQRINIQRERTTRQEHYKWAGSAQKGRGGKRARVVWTKLNSRWRDFTKRYNREVAKKLIETAIRNGCKRIVYIQPKECYRDKRYLSVAGHDGVSKMSWDYFQFGTLLRSKGDEFGIEVETAEAKPRQRMRSVRFADEPKYKVRIGKKASDMQPV